jgi:hypothetical protein
MNIGTTEFISSMEMDRREQKCYNNDATTLIITTHRVVDLIVMLSKPNTTDSQQKYQASLCFVSRFIL